jgi:two-component system, chemotaxis family, chemotaxis protein CheY
MKLCLVIDDSEIVRRVAIHLLQSPEMRFIEADSGERALEMCKAGMPDMLIVDWQMPGMSGIEFIQSLRLQAGGDVPFVIYCSTENNPDDIARALTAGANDYLLKPFDRESLKAVMFHEDMAAA